MPSPPTSKHKAIASRSAVVYQELGEILVKNSLSTITEFNRFTIGTCFGAIPVFLGLLKLAVPENTVLRGSALNWSVVVVVVLLFGSLMALFGYMPLSDRIGLQEPDSVRDAVKSAVGLRRVMAWSSVSLLIVGVLLACYVVLFGFVSCP